MTCDGLFRPLKANQRPLPSSHSYLTPFRWAQEGLISTQFEFETGPACIPNGIPSAPNNSACSDEGQVFTVGDNDPFCCPSGSVGSTPRDYVFSEEFLGGSNGYSFDWRWWDALYLFIFGILVRILGIIVTVHVNHNKR